MASIPHVPTTTEPRAELNELQADVNHLDDGPELDAAIDRLIATTAALAAMVNLSPEQKRACAEKAARMSAQWQREEAEEAARQLTPGPIAR